MIFGWSDSFRTATNLSATSRQFYSIWSYHTPVIVREITSAMLLYPREANLLADLYEESDAKWHKEILKCLPAEDRAPDAIRRAIALVDELQILRHLVQETIKMD